MQRVPGPRAPLCRREDQSPGLPSAGWRSRAQGSPVQRGPGPRAPLGSQERGMTGSRGPRGGEKGHPLAGGQHGYTPQGRQDSAYLLCVRGTMSPGDHKPCMGWGLCERAGTFKAQRRLLLAPAPRLSLPCESAQPTPSGADPAAPDSEEVTGPERAGGWPSVTQWAGAELEGSV